MSRGLQLSSQYYYLRGARAGDLNLAAGLDSTYDERLWLDLLEEEEEEKRYAARGYYTFPQHTWGPRPI